MDERERALAAGAAGYLLKPVLAEDLARALERAIARAAQPAGPAGELAEAGLAGIKAQQPDAA